MDEAFPRSIDIKNKVTEKGAEHIDTNAVYFKLEFSYIVSCIARHCDIYVRVKAPPVLNDLSIAR